ncbi:MAG: sigma-70 family RNA polymerase sigma factor [Gammaproteobacteria bacterium]|nr:sigma-70 family RNA polymerase sigma factor [Gammaproteobacteria bacterium]
MTDEELMIRVQRKDTSAFSVLLGRHSAAIHAFVFRLTGNAADAEDFTQETFLRVWSRADTWRPGRVKFTTWAYRIARNLCIDAWRSRRGSAADPETDVEELAADAPSDDAGRTRRALEAALAALPERQRTALVLCHHQGWSNREAAQMLDVSVDALESLLSRARRSLRKTLAPYREA